MGSSLWIDDQILKKRTPSYPSHESVVSRIVQKQRRWKIIHTLLCRWWFDWNCFRTIFLSISSVSTESQICVKNTVHVKQVRGDPFWQSNPTHCSRHQFFEIVTLASSCDSCLRKSIAEAQRTDRQAVTTRSSVKDLYWWRILVNSWSRTVLHDEAHWRVLTIYRASDISWVHFTTRWKINWPEMLDSREHQNWAFVRSHNQLFAR